MRRMIRWTRTPFCESCHKTLEWNSDVQMFECPRCQDVVPCEELAAELSKIE